MQKAEAEEFVGKTVKIVTLSHFNFTGEVLQVSETSLTIRDKFSQRVTLSLQDIMICSGVGNGS